MAYNANMAGASRLRTTSPLRQPPPLPPRKRSEANLLTPETEAPPPYSPYSYNMGSHDPRSSSTQSLVPVPQSEHAGRRTLLLIFIHGFMGNETSFQSFPAHVHNLVTVTLGETHVVHTKIYPRYKSRGAIELARDDFSNWLAPHESPTTDVILLGHSMGGLLASEVALCPPYSPATGHAFRHRIVGTVNFDTPFLGMHPGVVVSGLGSIFRPADSPDGAQIQDTGGSSSSDNASQLNRVNTLFSPKPSDPNYNPVFSNDVNLPVREVWESAMHFVSKHSDGLMKATKSYVTSHLEFGGVMADYPGLKNRYARIRALEEEDESVRRAATTGIRSPPRIRFLNYYTASTGRPKKPKSSSPRPSSQNSGREGEESRGRSTEIEMQRMRLVPTSTKNSRHSRSPSASPRISVEEHCGNIVMPKEPNEPLSALSDTEIMEVRHIDSMPINEELEDSATPASSILSPITTQRSNDTFMSGLETQETTATSLNPLSPALSLSLTPTPTLPPIPPVPQEPLEVDFSLYTDKDARKIAEKEHSRVVKAYKQVIKDRNSAIKDRAKLQEKIKKNKQKEVEKARKAEEREQANWGKERKVKEKAEQKAKGDKASSDQKAKEEKEEFSWEKVWAADRAREEEQREFERLHREGKVKDKEEFEQLSHEGDFKDKQESLYREETEQDQSQRSALEQTESTTSAYDHSTNTILNADTPSARADEAARKDEAKKNKSKPKLQVDAPEKPKRDKKFCMLPPRDSHGHHDPTWIRIFMEGVDEVGAHCGLFFVSETYERLVGDVADRVEEWVRVEMSERYVRGLDSRDEREVTCDEWHAVSVGDRYCNAALQPNVSS
ncbi:hypothetical protein K432DRAFT_426225 [Lepidopterella palustris CBS 459.81]|uniref:AB hydrolase-1 domain-containing protein n=1 Tax=Lepidopterella palustris CBS 459.81 TaxID=1314670 RepID=A0A8E2E9K6_9PEZI|nr:hypothetical protein K432DRAFT_426225 [Lepidopterella palustris CBS 459.81]